VDGVAEGTLEAVAEATLEGEADDPVDGVAEGTLEGEADDPVDGVADGTLEGEAEGTELLEIEAPKLKDPDAVDDEEAVPT